MNVDSEQDQVMTPQHVSSKVDPSTRGDLGTFQEVSRSEFAQEGQRDLQGTRHSQLDNSDVALESPGHSLAGFNISKVPTRTIEDCAVP